MRSSATRDNRRPSIPTINKHESGHPLEHRFTRAIPTSQCMVCHMHQPNMFMNTFMGYTMWDYESDAPAMWPAKQQYPDAAETRAVNERNPEGAAPQGQLGRCRISCSSVSELNPTLHDTQFADYHGHGWNFRAVFKRDRHGNLLDAKGADRSATTIRRNSRKPCTWPRSTWRRACSAWTATSRRTATATATSMAKSPPPWRSTASTATARCAAYPTCAPRAGGARRAAPTCRCCATPMAPSASSGATASCISARLVEPGHGMARQAGQGQRRPGIAATTTSKRRAPSCMSRDTHDAALGTRCAGRAARARQ